MYIMYENTKVRSCSLAYGNSLKSTAWINLSLHIQLTIIEKVKFLLLRWNVQTDDHVRRESKGNKAKVLFFLVTCFGTRLIWKLQRQRVCFMLRVPHHFFHPLTCLQRSWSVTLLAHPAVNSQPGRTVTQLNIWSNNRLTQFHAYASKDFSTKVKFLVAIINAQARVLATLPFVRHNWLNVVSCSW